MIRKHMWKEKAKLKKKGVKKILTIFEKVMQEVKNMEHCIEHYIQVSTDNQQKKFSRIDQNESKHISTVRLSDYRQLPTSMARATSYNISPQLPNGSFDSESSDSQDSQYDCKTLGNALEKNESFAQSYLTRESSFLQNGLGRRPSNLTKSSEKDAQNDRFFTNLQSEIQ